MDILEKVKQFQVALGITDAQMAEKLGYKHRAGWAKIKGGIIPANHVFELRALKAFPELGAIHSNPAESTQDSRSKGVKGILDKVVLIVKKLV